MDGDDHETFGSRLRRLMDTNGLNQSQVAKRSGIDRSVVNRLLSGKARPKHEQIGWLAKVLGVDIDELAACAEADVRRAIVHTREASEHVLRIRADRDRAFDRVAELETELRRERDDRERERTVFTTRLAALERQIARLQRRIDTEAAAAGRPPGSTHASLK